MGGGEYIYVREGRLYTGDFGRIIGIAGEWIEPDDGFGGFVNVAHGFF